MVMGEPERRAGRHLPNPARQAARSMPTVQRATACAAARHDCANYSDLLRKQLNQSLTSIQCVGSSPNRWPAWVAAFCRRHPFFSCFGAVPAWPGARAGTPFALGAARCGPHAAHCGYPRRHRPGSSNMGGLPWRSDSALYPLKKPRIARPDCRVWFSEINKQKYVNKHIHLTINESEMIAVPS